MPLKNQKVKILKKTNFKGNKQCSRDFGIIWKTLAQLTLPTVFGLKDTKNHSTANAEQKGVAIVVAEG